MLVRISRFAVVALAAGAVLSLTSLALALAQTTYYVNGSCGNDSWTGLSPVCEAPDGPKATIQAGIDAADHFDSVGVADGIYRGAGNKNLEFFTKEMSIHSAGGPEMCIIDCEDDGLGFTFCTLPDDRPVTIEGFTIRNGRGVGVGGICISVAEVTIDNCIIEHCVTTNPLRTSEYAGGILIIGSPVLIARTIVRNNRVEGSGVSGGGIKILARGNQHTVRIEDCDITGNVADPAHPSDGAAGGGVFVGNGAAMHMTRCLVADNVVVGIDFLSTAGAGVAVFGVSASTIEHTEFRGNHVNPGLANTLTRGGGAWLASGTLVRDCTVINNSAALGGGLYLDGGLDDLIQRTLVRGNFAHMDGGGVYCSMFKGEDIELIDNTAGGDGGGIYFTQPSFELRWTRTTLINNEAQRDGGGAFTTGLLDFSHFRLKGNVAGRNGGAVCSVYGPTIRDSLLLDNRALGKGGAIYTNQANFIINSTIARNAAASGGGGLHVEEEGLSEYAAHNCIFRDNLPVSIFDASGNLRVNRSNVEGGWPGTGNLDVDPLFADPMNDDFSLLAGSPCIDAGDSRQVEEGEDLAGLPRRMDDQGMPDSGIGLNAIVDMGCYEFQGASTGFIAVHPRPGIAGQNNQLQAAGAMLGNVVYFVYGFATGSTGVPGCPGLSIEIANPRIAARATADGSGYASSVIAIPGAAAGRSIVLQAVDHDACEVSNVVGYRFP